jgi:tripartite-type tricarboxylate transporter receptor subunit TctC
VPYKGGADIMKALLAGEVDFAFTGVTPAVPFVRQGQIRGLAYGGPKRSPSLPDVPSFTELGMKGFETGSWFGWLVPAGTPAAATEKISADVGQVLAQPEFTQKYVTGVGMEPMHLPPAQFGELLRSDREKFGVLVKKIQLKLD